MNSMNVASRTLERSCFQYSCKQFRFDLDSKCFYQLGDSNSYKYGPIYLNYLRGTMIGWFAVSEMFVELKF